MKRQVRDRKNPITYAILSTVNHAVIANRFRQIGVVGLEHLPASGPLILVCNHTRRWDGLLWYHLLNRPANFMVSPDELSGLQGAILRSMGSFPASSSYDLNLHVRRRLAKGEPVVIFPEGDIFRDGVTHRFKSGAARFALNIAQCGLDVPVIPAAVRYDEQAAAVEVLVAPAVHAADYLPVFAQEQARAVRHLTERLHREVCHARFALGDIGDTQTLFGIAQNHPRSAALPQPPSAA